LDVEGNHYKEIMVYC